MQTPSNYCAKCGFETRYVAVDWRSKAVPISNPVRTMPPVTAGSSLVFKPPPLEFAKRAAIVTFNLSHLWGVHTGEY